MAMRTAIVTGRGWSPSCAVAMRAMPAGRDATPCRAGPPAAAAARPCSTAVRCAVRSAARAVYCPSLAVRALESRPPRPLVLRGSSASFASGAGAGGDAAGGGADAGGGAKAGATTTLSAVEYARVADATLDLLEDVLGALEDSVGPELEDDFDCTNAQGVLTLVLGGKGTYVINKQAPNREIWWSSPLSGPKRFYWHGDDAEAGEWRSTRDGQAMLTLLAAEVQTLLGVDVSADLLE